MYKYTGQKAQKGNKMGCGSEIKILNQKGSWSLVRRGTDVEHDYIAVQNIEMTKDGTYGWGSHSGYHCPSKNPVEQLASLVSALECYRQMTEPNYIPRARLEELATQFKDGLIDDDKYEAWEYFTGSCEMEEHELEWFGIENPNEVSESEEEVLERGWF